MAKNTGPSPLVFPTAGSAQVEKPVAPAVGVPGTLTFKSSPPTVAPQQPATINFVQTNTPRAQPKRDAVPPKSVFNVVKTDRELIAIETAKTKFPEVFATSSDRIERQIMQLIPIDLQVVMGWATNTIGKISALTNQVSQLGRDFAQADASMLVQETLNVLKNSTNTSILGSLKRKGKTVNDYTPRLRVVQTQLVSWLPKCAELSTQAAQLHTDLSIKLIALSVAIDSTSPQPGSIDVACNNRRVLCQQSVQQAQLLTLQIDQLQQQLIDVAARIDQLIQITIPAFLNTSR